MVCVEYRGEHLPDANNEVLIAQLTSIGEISGTINVQVLPEGAEGIGSDVQKTFQFAGAGVYAAVGEGNAAVARCAACNYDANANYDDGSCLQADECGVCGGDGIAEGRAIATETCLTNVAYAAVMASPKGLVTAKAT